MRLPKTMLCFVLLTIIACKKNNEGIAASLPQLSALNVDHIRDTTNTVIRFIVAISPATSKTITVHYATEDGSAKANVDYVPASGTLSVDANAMQATIDVQVIGRKLLSGTQNFYLALSDASNATIKVVKATANIKNPGFGYVLVWKDEFDSTALNTNAWSYETGGGGWGNNELENYTSGTNNAYLQSGNLVIEAKKESSGSNSYSSARLSSKGKIKFTYGKIDIRAKLPATKGIWPALWMLGENIDQVNWPNCGEIDIMELINQEQPSKVYGTAHWGLNGAHQSSGGNFALPSGYFSDDFHVFSLEWDQDHISWLVDSNQYFQVIRSNVTSDTYPFDRDFFLILNVAVGGNWPGSPDATSVFPQKMLVDYIRVFQK